MPSTRTIYYDALLTTTLEKWLEKNVMDQIMTSNAFLYKIMSRPGGYRRHSSLGERARIPLRYALGVPDSYGNYDNLKAVPYDGLTTAFYEWRQSSDAVMISGMERAQNAGQEAALNLLREKKDQVMDGTKEWFAKAILQGQGINTGANITDPYTSPVNGSVFVEPMFGLIRANPAASVVIGNINQSLHAWWRNRFLSSSAANYAEFLSELDAMWMDCGKGPGGRPDLHLCDENVFRLYLRALRAFHENPSYRKADIPFETILFHGMPLTWDEFMPNVQAGTTALAVAQGTWAMIQTGMFQIQVHAGTDFKPTPFVIPTLQDAMISHVMWKGALTCSSRRKQGVIFNMDTRLTS